VPSTWLRGEARWVMCEGPVDRLKNLRSLWSDSYNSGDAEKDHGTSDAERSSNHTAERLP
jgi:hypothetical protein